jgi:hypothetical protein
MRVILFKGKNLKFINSINEEVFKVNLEKEKDQIIGIKIGKIRR